MINSNFMLTNINTQFLPVSKESVLEINDFVKKIISRGNILNQFSISYLQELEKFIVYTREEKIIEREDFSEHLFYLLFESGYISFASHNNTNQYIVTNKGWDLANVLILLTAVPFSSVQSLFIPSVFKGIIGKDNLIEQTRLFNLVGCNCSVERNVTLGDYCITLYPILFDFMRDSIILFANVAIEEKSYPLYLALSRKNFYYICNMVNSYNIGCYDLRNALINLDMSFLSDTTAQPSIFIASGDSGCLFAEVNIAFVGLSSEYSRFDNNAFVDFSFFDEQNKNHSIYQSLDLL